MKATIIRSDLEAAPEFEPRDVLIQLSGGQWCLPQGYVIDHPQAFRLVQQGVAEPADDECAQRANRTPEQMRAAQAAYQSLLDRHAAAVAAGHNNDDEDDE